MKKWKPSSSQRRAFAERMKNADELSAYLVRKREREERRRATSRFDYESAGGEYVPSQTQYNFCITHYESFLSREEREAANLLIFAYDFNEKIHHDFIHIVNEIMRRN